MELLKKSTELEKLACRSSLHDRERSGDLQQSGQRSVADPAACAVSSEAMTEHLHRQFSIEGGGELLDLDTGFRVSAESLSREVRALNTVRTGFTRGGPPVAKDHQSLLEAAPRASPEEERRREKRHSDEVLKWDHHWLKVAEQKDWDTVISRRPCSLPVRGSGGEGRSKEDPRIPGPGAEGPEVGPRGRS